MYDKRRLYYKERFKIQVLFDNIVLLICDKRRLHYKERFKSQVLFDKMVLLICDKRAFIL